MKKRDKKRINNLNIIKSGLRKQGKRALALVLAVLLAGTGADYSSFAQAKTDATVKVEGRSSTFEPLVFDNSPYQSNTRRKAVLSSATATEKYYDQLDADSQRIYDLLMNKYQAGPVQTVELTNQELTVTVSNAGSAQSEIQSACDAFFDKEKADAFPAFSALTHDHPEMSWIGKTGYAVSYFTSGFNVVSTSPLQYRGTITTEFTLSDYSTYCVNLGTKTQMDSDIAKAVTALKAKGIDSAVKVYDKVKIIHDYICERIVYDTANTGYYQYQTAYSGLHDFGTATNKSVCAGYATSFKVLCDYYSIPCILVSGKGVTNSTGPSGEEHMWNYVKMNDGNWYGVDCTWDDQTTIYYDFFLVGSNTTDTSFGGKTFAASHIPDGSWSTSGSFVFQYPSLCSSVYVPTKTDDTVTVTTAGNNLKKTYNGSPLEISTTKGTDVTWNGTGSASVEYYIDKNGTKTTVANSGAAGTGTAPVNKGVYYGKVTVAGDANYNGATSDYIKLEIEGKTLTSSMIQNFPQKEYYTGSAIKPAFTLQDSDLSKTLSEGTDYTVSYKNNINVHDGASANPPTVTITGQGNYTGTLTQTFAIALAEFSGTVLYNGKNTPDSYYKDAVKISASGNTVSLSATGSFSQEISISKPSTDGEIKKTVYFKDSTGKITQKEITLDFDITVPVFSGTGYGISIETNNWKSFLNTITFGTFFQNDKEVTIEAFDNYSGVDRYYYYIDNSGNTSVLSKSTLDKKTFQELPRSKVGKFQLSTEQKCVIYAYAVDVAGNRSDYICSNGIILDKTAPTFSFAAAKDDLIKDVSATLQGTCSEEGKITYVIKTMPDSGITAEQIKKDTTSKSVNVTASAAGSLQNISLTGLKTGTVHYVYAVAEDLVGNLSAVQSISFATKKVQLTVSTKPSLTGSYGMMVKDMVKPGIVRTGSNEVKGVWEVTDADRADVPSVGTKKDYEVTFTPEDSSYGQLTVRVVPLVTAKNLTEKDVIVSDVAEAYTYDGKAKQPGVTVIAAGTTLTTNDYVLTYSNNTRAYTLREGETGFNASLAPTVTITGKGNYTGTVKKYFTIGKVVLTISKMPAANAITYGQTLAAAKFTGGEVKYGTGDDTLAAGDFVWKNAATKPTVADSGVTEYDVVFNPKEAGNFDALECKMTVVVNKANEPQEIPGFLMNVNNSVTKISEIALPANWKWSDSTKDIVLQVNVEVSATAEYTGADKGNYNVEQMTVKVIRGDHNHVAGTQRFDGDGDRQPTCTMLGRAHTNCTICGCVVDTNISVPALGHSFGQWVYADEKNHKHVCTRNGCGEFELQPHSFDGGIVTKQPTSTQAGERVYTCSICGGTKTETIPMLGPVAPTATPTPTAAPSASPSMKPSASPSVEPEEPVVEEEPLEVGEEVVDDKLEAIYTVTSTARKTVKYSEKLISSKTVVIPNTVKFNGETYKVTAVSGDAFYGRSSMTKLVIGNNVTTIGSRAFAHCTKLKQITMSKNLKTIGSNAFYNCKALTKITIGQYVEKIGSKSFANCKKLKSIVIQSKKLSKSKVGSKAFSGIVKKATFQVPKSKAKTYKAMFIARGASKSIKIKKK